ncbi:MAG: aminoglycoside phosphotransferase family protein [Fimbriimonadaceae bacterium]
MHPTDVADARATAEQLAAEWRFSLGSSLPGASCSVVFEVPEDRVLKVPFPHAEEAGAWKSVNAFSSHGGVAVLRHDPVSGGILMPRLRPGTTLDTAGLTDLEQVDICAASMLTLRGAPLVDAIPLTAWFKELDDVKDARLARKARQVYGDLQATPIDSVLLHGDLHHGNILRHGDSWVVIDPKGLVGDPSFDVAGFMRNPIGKTPAVEGMRARLERFAERLGDPIERLWGWAFVQTVVCTCSPTSFGDACKRAAQAIWDARS